MGSGESDALQVLLVDDEPDFAEMAATFLERESDRFSVETVTSAGEGFDRLADEVDCVVSDYDMPGRNGVDFLEAVRTEYPDLPFILFTGKGSEEVASEALSAGATDYLQKTSGTEQYELLANRIRNAVERYRTKRRTERLNRIRALVNDVNQALVRADSRAEIETRVCDIISSSGPYRFAWIGEIDAETDRIEPRTSAGIEEGYLDEITVTVDEEPTGRGPSGTAVRERRVAVSQDIRTDPEFAPWREAASERGYRAAAAVPLAHEETLYGVLVVYAERTYAFDEEERELLAELGGDISLGLHALDVQQELREEQAFIEQALDTLDDLFYVVGPDGTLSRWNERLTAVTGYTDAEIDEMHAVEFFPEGEERDRIAAAIEETLASGKTIVEADLLTADGERIPYEFTGDRLIDSEGDLVGLVGIGRDISDRKERERQLREERAFVETILSALPDALYAFDHEGNFLRWNERLTAVTGYTDAEIEEMEPLDFIPDEEATKIAENIAAVVEDGETVTVESYFETKDGEHIPYEFTGAPLVDREGESLGLVGIGRDVTERRERERELRQQHDRFRTLFEHFPEPTVAVTFEDGEPIAREINPAFEETFGHDADAVTGRSLNELVVPDDHSPDAERIDAQARQQELLNREVSREAADGRRDFLFRNVPLGEDEEYDQFGFYIDITERRERERELERQNERLEAFASIISHDLRNPLAVAAGRLALAREDCDSEHLDAVDRAHDRMGALIDDLLTLARQGEAVDEMEPVELADVVETCWRHVETGSATLRVETDRTIRADEDRLQQLLANLVRNAVEHGGDDVTVTVGDLAEPPGFYVADDGPGIPAEERSAIFEAGYSTAEDGTGFGLSIVQEIAEAHGWTVDATDSADGGSRASPDRRSGGARFEITGVDRVG